MTRSVSVLMSAFNAEARLRASLASIESQTYPIAEIVLVDDGSTDGTNELMQDFKRRAPNVTILRNPRNLGIPRAHNRGIEAAQGDWLARLDADDEWHPEKTARQMAYLDAHPEIGLIGSWSISHNQITGEQRLVRKPEHHEAIVNAIWRACPFTHSSIIARRDVLVNSGGYDPDCLTSQDYELFFRLLFQTRAYNLPTPLVYRPTHELGNISTRKWKLQQYTSLQIRLRNLRKHQRPPRDYLHLLPGFAILLLPNGAKRWKQHLTRPRHAKEAAPFTWEAFEKHHRPGEDG